MIGVVLAGGAGKRLGRPKGELRLDGRSLSQRAAETLWPRCLDVLISTQPGLRSAPTFHVVFDDAPPGCGPLAGLAACFRASGRADLLVLACDYPRIDGPFLDQLLERARPEADVVFAIDRAGRDHPLVGIWRRSAAARVQAAVEETRYKVRSLLRELEVHRISVDDLCSGADRSVPDKLLNVNHPADWEQLGGESL